MNKEYKTKLIVTIVFLGFILSFLFHFYNGVFLGLSYPHDTFLFLPSDRFRDFFALLEWNQNLNPYLQKYATPQYPLLNFVCFILSRLSPWDAFLLYNGITIALFVFIVSHYIKAVETRIRVVRILIFSFLTYPFLFTIDRGNFESLLSVVLLFFVFFYYNKKFKTAAFFLSIAISMKLFPVVMLVLFFSDKKYKEIALTIGIVFIIAILCLAAFKGGFYPNIKVLMQGSNMNNNPMLSAYFGNNNLVQRGVSLFTVLKILLLQLGLVGKISVLSALIFYSIVMIIFFILLSTYVLMIEKTPWKKLAILVFSMLLFPHVSADYKLLHVFIPLFLFIDCGEAEKFDLIYAVLFALLLVPKDYWILPGIVSDAKASDISIAVLLNPLIMIVMICMIVFNGLNRTSRAEILLIAYKYTVSIRNFIRRKPFKSKLV